MLQSLDEITHASAVGSMPFCPQICVIKAGIATPMTWDHQHPGPSHTPVWTTRLALKVPILHRFVHDQNQTTFPTPESCLSFAGVYTIVVVPSFVSSIRFKCESSSRSGTTRDSYRERDSVVVREQQTEVLVRK